MRSAAAAAFAGAFVAAAPDDEASGAPPRHDARRGPRDDHQHHSSSCSSLRPFVPRLTRRRPVEGGASLPTGCGGALVGGGWAGIPGLSTTIRAESPYDRRHTEQARHALKAVPTLSSSLMRSCPTILAVVRAWPVCRTACSAAWCRRPRTLLGSCRRPTPRGSRRASRGVERTWASARSTAARASRTRAFRARGRGARLALGAQGLHLLLVERFAPRVRRETVEHAGDVPEVESHGRRPARPRPQRLGREAREPLEVSPHLHERLGDRHQVRFDALEGALQPGLGAHRVARQSIRSRRLWLHSGSSRVPTLRSSRPSAARTGRRGPRGSPWTSTRPCTTQPSMPGSHSAPRTRWQTPSISCGQPQELTCGCYTTVGARSSEGVPASASARRRAARSPRRPVDRAQKPERVRPRPVEPPVTFSPAT